MKMIRKRIARILVILTAFMVAFVFLMAEPAHAATGYRSVGKAYKLLNQFRTSKTWCWNEDDRTKTWVNTNSSNRLKKLKKSAVLEKTAKKRVKELSKRYSHIRPNGKICFSIYPDAMAVGENIAMNTILGSRGKFRTAEQIMVLWEERDQKFAGQGHRRAMLSPTYNAVGIARYRKGNSEYWVQCFAQL